MQKKITISLDSKLLDYTAEHFGYKNINENYSELVEKALLYIVKPQFYSFKYSEEVLNEKKETAEYKTNQKTENLISLLEEAPEWDKEQEQSFNDANNYLQS